MTGPLLHSFWLCFIPLFVAVDALGVLPIFAGLTDGVPKKKLRAIALQSMTAALIAGILFLVGGKWILGKLGISISDFMIAGGILLFVISISDIISVQKWHRVLSGDDMGAVPIGVPLIVGPAVLATGIMLVEDFGLLMVLACLTLNILLAGIALWLSPVLTKVLGKAGSKVLSKLAALLLSAFAVMMVRRGLGG
jgi:multiple antibiotic resistance protein